MSSTIEKIKLRRDKNAYVLSLVASYLNNCPDLVTEEIIKGITNATGPAQEKAFASFLSNVFTEDEGEVRWLEKEYMSKAVKCLCTEEYTENPFYKNIKIPKTSVGNWDFGYQSYKPYEGFIYRDLLKCADYTEIPQIGYFCKEFSFPTVYENGREWMAIKPNEIETMRLPVEKAKGRVLVYGLGIGYFAYMVSQKDNVDSVCIVEREQSVIDLFNAHILPQFPNKSKITVVKSDAFEYAEKEMKKGKFDYVFTDLWHDVSDGVDLYIKMKKYEGACTNSAFEYWIEDSILSSIRWSIFDGIYKKTQNKELNEAEEHMDTYLSDSYLKEFVKFI